MSVYRLKIGDTDLAMRVSQLFFNKETTLANVNSFLACDHNYLLIYRYEEIIAGFGYGYELQRFDGRKK